MQWQRKEDIEMASQHAINNHRGGRVADALCAGEKHWQSCSTRPPRQQQQEG